MILITMTWHHKRCSMVLLLLLLGIRECDAIFLTYTLQNMLRL